jgi:hypothetical protein
VSDSVWVVPCTFQGHLDPVARVRGIVTVDACVAVVQNLAGNHNKPKWLFLFMAENLRSSEFAMCGV